MFMLARCLPKDGQKVHLTPCNHSKWVPKLFWTKESNGEWQVICMPGGRRTQRKQVVLMAWQINDLLFSWFRIGKQGVREAVIVVGAVAELASTWTTAACYQAKNDFWKLPQIISGQQAYIAIRQVCQQSGFQEFLLVFRRGTKEKQTNPMGLFSLFHYSYVFFLAKGWFLLCFHQRQRAQKLSSTGRFVNWSSAPSLVIAETNCRQTF